MKKIYVVASSIHAFLRSGAENLSERLVKTNHSQGILYTEDNEYHFISHPERLRGLHGADVEFWEGWEVPRSKEVCAEFMKNAQIARQK